MGFRGIRWGRRVLQEFRGVSREFECFSGLEGFRCLEGI